MTERGVAASATAPIEEHPGKVAVEFAELTSDEPVASFDGGAKADERVNSEEVRG
jgi:hypothetical protein